MKKIIFILFAISSLSLGFTSCGSDDDPVPVDLTVRDLSPLIGQYKGTCIINVLDKVKSPVNKADNNVKLIKTSDNNVLLLSTPEFGVITDGDKLQNFKYTSEAKTAITFTMGGYTSNGITGGSIPQYIIDWFGADYTTVNKIDMSVKSTTATYNVTTKLLEFKYQATIIIYATVNGKDQQDTHSLSYTYSTTWYKASTND